MTAEDDGAWTLEWHDDFEGDHLDMSEISESQF